MKSPGFVCESFMCYWRKIRSYSSTIFMTRTRSTRSKHWRDGKSGATPHFTLSYLTFMANKFVSLKCENFECRKKRTLQLLWMGDSIEKRTRWISITSFTVSTFDVVQAKFIALFFRIMTSFYLIYTQYFMFNSKTAVSSIAHSLIIYAPSDSRLISSWAPSLLKQYKCMKFLRLHPLLHLFFYINSIG